MLEGHIQQDSEFSREAAITLCKRGTKIVDSDAGFSGYQFTRDLRAKAVSDNMPDSFLYLSLF